VRISWWFVRAEKVPAEMYDLADWNVAVDNQPHSEVAALASFWIGSSRVESFVVSLKEDSRLCPIPEEKQVLYPSYIATIRKIDLKGHHLE